MVVQPGLCRTLPETPKTGPASGMVGRGFAPRLRHTKGGKNGTGSSLADARNKRVVPGRYKKAGWYSLLVMLQ